MSYENRLSNGEDSSADIEEVFTFGKDGTIRNIPNRGWEVDPEHLSAQWTCQKWATVTLPFVYRPTPLLLICDVEPFLSDNKVSYQTIVAYRNGSMIGVQNVFAAAKTSFLLAEKQTDLLSLNRIAFFFPKVMRSEAAGSDGKLLGLLFHSIKIVALRRSREEQ